MSAATVALRLTDNLELAARIEAKLTRFSDDECEVVLRRIEDYRTAARGEGLEVLRDAELILRAVDAAADAVRDPGDAWEPPSGDQNGSGASTKPAGEGVPRWTALNFARIESSGVPELDWIFLGWIVAEDIFLFAGDAHVGKSTLLSAMGYAAASGGEWIGIPVARKLRVLYVDEEQSESEVYGLFTKHGPRLPSEDLRVFVQQGANLDSDDGLAILEREIADFAPALLLIDSATAAFGRVDGNSNADVAAIFRRLFHLRQAHRLTIGFNHHLGKPGEVKRSLMHRVLGSVAFGTQASAVFGVVSHDATSVELTQAKRRLGPRPYPSMIVGYREEAGRCFLENRGAVEDTTGAVALCSEWAVHYLRGTSGPEKAGAIAEAAKRHDPPFNEDVVTKALKHGLNIGVLEKPKRGWYAIKGSAQLTLVKGDRDV